jgi:hypothetical protein
MGASKEVFIGLANMFKRMSRRAASTQSRTTQHTMENIDDLN